MKLKIYQVDAFAKGPFTGNPAAVIPLGQWLDDELMQNIAMENNLSETAFFVKENGNYHIRWFTPTIEVRLCGHATLASAYVLFNFFEKEKSTLSFNSLGGDLSVLRQDDRLILDFPTDVIETVEQCIEIEEALGRIALEKYRGLDDYMLVFETQEEVSQMTPDFTRLKTCATRGILVTAPGKNVDFISRGFFPAFGIDEDPATGSAHTTLTQYWANRLNKNKLSAIQWSSRKGYFNCEYRGDRTLIAGHCHLYLEGEIEV